MESCLPGDLSYEQSGGFGDIVALVSNFFGGTVTAKMVEPTSISLSADSTYLAPIGDVPQIGIGTTTRLTYSVSGGTLGKGEYLNPYFTAEAASSTDSDGLFNVLVDVSSHSVYIVSVGEAMADCSIQIKAGSNLTTTYSFDIVDLPSPTDALYSVTAPSLSIKENESETLAVTLSDTAKDKDDLYLRRYFDVSKLSHFSSDDSVATIDKYGVIRGVSQGSATVHYGKAAFTISVSGSGTLADNTTHLSISKETSASTLALNDYDYVGSETTGAGVRLIPSFTGTLPSDTSLTWQVVDSDGNDDPLTAKIRVGTDGDAMVYGYRKKGTAYIKATSNTSPSLIATLDLPIGEILPETFSLFSGSTALTDGLANGGTVSLSEFNAGEITLYGSFLGPNANPNVTDKSLNVVTTSDAVVISGNGTSMVTIDFVKEGSATVVVSSAANSDLSYTCVFTIAATPNVDPNSTLFQTFIRKFFGHASLFALSAVFGFLFFILLWEDEKGWISSLSAAGCGLLLAMLTEAIQHFVPGRFGAWSDVGIDMAGVLIGILLTLGIYWLVLVLRKHEAKKRKLSQNPSKN